MKLGLSSQFTHKYPEVTLTDDMFNQRIQIVHASVLLQLRYYDSAEDPSCKGFIDMKEVTSVVELSNVQGLPKRADDHAVFEVI